MLFTYKSGFPFVYEINSVKGLEKKDIRNYKKEEMMEMKLRSKYKVTSPSKLSIASLTGQMKCNN